MKTTILNDATNWGPEADRINLMFSELYNSIYKQEVQLLAASKVIKSFANYDAIEATYPDASLLDFGVFGLLVSNIETGTLWQYRVNGWVNTTIAGISDVSYNKFEIPVNSALPTITDYQTTFALVFGQIPTVKLWEGSDVTTWTMLPDAAQTTLSGGLINTIFFDLGRNVIGKIIIS